MRVLNPLSLVAGIGLLVAVAQAQVKHTFDEDGSLSSATEKGRSLFNFGIMKKISNFFGFGEDSNRKMSGPPSVYRRPEMLPFEILYSQNRRSDYQPNVNRRRDSVPHGASKYGPGRPKQAAPPVGYRGKRPSWNKGPMNRISHVKPNTDYRTVNPYDNLENSKPFHKDSKIPSTKFHRKSYGSFNKKTLKNDPYTKVVSYPGTLKVPQMENRKPASSFFPNEDEDSESVSGIEKKETVGKSQTHSKFALKNYASNIDSRHVSEQYPKESSYPKKNSNFYKVGSSISYDKKVKKPNVKNGYGQRKKVHPYPFVTLKPTNPQYEDFYDEDPLIALGHGPEPIYATSERGEILRPYKRNKQKGLFENVSDFASNLFGNILPKPSSKQSQAIRRRLRNPSFNKIQTYESVPRSASDSSSSSSHLNSLSSLSSRLFAPSPQQGTIASDSFQPIFVPSHSMDRNLPNDIMKPLIVPQKRKAQIQDEPSVNKPELINFF